MKNLKKILLVFSFFISFNGLSNLILVKSLGDAGVGTLRWAYTQANPGDTIIIDVKGQIELLTPISINNADDVVLIGAFPKHNTIVASGGWLAGTGLSLFEIQNSNGISIENIGFPISPTTDIRAINIFSSSGNAGPPVKINRCLFENIDNNSFAGGAITSSGSTIISNCSFLSNKADRGGAIHINSALQTMVLNCSFIANTATNNGGVLWVQGTGEVILTNNTYSENNSANDLGEVCYSDPNAVIILKNNAGAGNGNNAQFIQTSCCTYSSTGGNIFLLGGGTDSQVWVSSGTDQYDGAVIPGLRPAILEDGFGLKYYTITNPGSSFIDQGSNPGTLTSDCRKAPRILFGGLGAFADAGACEFTTLRVTVGGGGAAINTLGAALLLTPDPINYVEFDIPLAGPHVIDVSNTYTLNSDYIIDGYSQPGSAIPGPAPESIPGVTPGVMDIHLNNTIGVTTAIQVNGGTPNSSRIQGLRITGFDNTAIYVAQDNTKIFGCEIGLDNTLMADPNGTIAVYVGSDLVQIGGSAHWQRNVISGNAVGNISLDGSGAKVFGNFIGIGPDGVNGISGASTSYGIQNSGTNNLIGGAGYLEGNSIGDITGDGIIENGSLSSTIVHNNIGVGYDGMSSFPNFNGIFLTNGASNVILGGTGYKKTRNIISSNANANVFLNAASSTLIIGNYIGLDSSGYNQVSNSPHGILLNGAGVNDTQIGGFGDDNRNVISGNQNGINVNSTGAGSTILISNNYIGTDKDALTAIPNNEGVLIGANANLTTVGLPLGGNVISGNSITGVKILGGANHVVQDNLIGLNGTGNDTIGNGIGVHVEGANSVVVGGDFAANQGNVISGNVQDGVFVGNNATSTNVYGNIIGLDINGLNPLGNLINGVNVAIAFDTQIGAAFPGNGNIISGQSTITQGAGIFLESTGNGTNVANNYIGTDISGTMPIPNETGIRITDSHQTQIGSTPGFENYICANQIGVHVFSPGVTMDGNYVGVGVLGTFASMGNLDGIVVEGSNFAIGSLGANYWNIVSNNINDGIHLNGEQADFCTIDYCFIGTDGAGNAAGNGLNGIHIEDGDDNLVGTNLVNIINGSGANGIFIEGPASNNVIQENFIGDLTGTAGFENNRGIEITNGPNGTTIGSNSVLNGNTIVGNTFEGILINNADNNQILGNHIGIDIGGTSGPNAIGIRIVDSDFIDIGGSNFSGSESHNRISNNFNEGILMSNAHFCTIFGNYIGVTNNGLSAAPNTDGVVLQNGSSFNLIGDSGGSTIYRNVISGNTSNGIIIDASDSNDVQYNYIGMDANGVNPLDAQTIGIYIGNGAAENMFGGDASVHKNLISGNTSVGIIIDNADHNYIEGNTIGPGGTNQDIGIVLTGVNADHNEIGGIQLTTYGNVILDNTASGVEISNGAHDNFIHSNFIGIGDDNLPSGSNTQIIGVEVVFDAGLDNIIGDNVPGGGNIISGNNIGIQIVGASQQYVYNNFIGTDTTGVSPVPNNSAGVYLLGGANNNYIGGVAAYESNLISGNSIGVHIEGSGTSNNYVEGNDIGFDVTSSNPIPNGIGVGIETDASNNFIGGTGTGNDIGGNTICGISIFDAVNNYVEDNDIGVTFPNTHGIIIDGGALGNVIGGTPAERNIISGNDSIGVYITNGSSGNTLSSNYIGLQSDGMTLSENLIGVYIYNASGNIIGLPNFGEQNVISGNELIGLGLEEGANNNTIQNNYIGTGASGNAVFGGTDNPTGIYIRNCTGNLIGGDWNLDEGNVICNNLINGIWLDSAQTTTISGNNIGLSKDNNTYLGNQLADGILIDNGSTNNFIGVAGPGNENVITDYLTNIYVTQSYNNDFVNNYIGNDHLGGQGNVTFGTNNSTNGIILDSASFDNDIIGYNVISGNSNVGIGINGLGSNGNTVKGNVIGVEYDGLTSLPNSDYNIIIANGASNNLIGGGNPLDKNIIAGDVDSMIVLFSPGTDSNQVVGNNIGLGIDDIQTYNSNFGIVIFDGVGNTVGGGLPGEGNNITGFNQDGVVLTNANWSNVLGNRIGILPNGNAAACDSAGVLLLGADNCFIGGRLVGSDSANVITNCNRGVEITNYPALDGALANEVVGNSIYNNTEQGIDILGDDLQLPNDTNNVNFFISQYGIDSPEILTAWNCADGNLHIGFKFYASNAFPGYSYEIYTNPIPDVSGYGEGQVFRGGFHFDPITTLDTVFIDVGQPIAVGTVITATLTGITGNTSEFSQQFTVLPVPTIDAVNTLDEFCNGSTDGEIEITATGAHYFSIDGGLTWGYGYYGDTLSNLAPGSYTVDAQYLNGCSVSQSIGINAGPSLPVDTTIVADTCGMGVGLVSFDTTPTDAFGASGFYSYSFNNGITFGPASGVVNQSTGTLFLVLFDDTLGCYSDTLTVFIPEINDVVDENFEFDDFCPGNAPGPYNVATGGGAWMFNPIPSVGDTGSIDSFTGVITGAMTDTTYFVEYTVGQCFETHVDTVTAASIDDPTFVYDSLCLGDLPTITTITAGGTWSLVGGTGSIDTLSGAIVGPAGTYSVIYTTNGTCPATDTLPVALFPLPVTPTINFTQTQYCQGETPLPLTTTPDPNLNFSWYDDAALTNLLDSDTSFTPASIGFGNNYFYLIVQDTNGCVSNYDSINYTYADLSGVYAAPDMTVCLGSIVQLEAFGGGTYAWVMSDQITDQLDISNPSAKILVAETFIVTITDPNGCLVIDSINVDLLPLDSCYVETYNAFSPNNDGTNDYWVIDGIEGYPENTVIIFNRWGDKMKRIDNYNNADAIWDGTNKNNRPVPAGTYFYVVEVNGDRSSAGWVQVVK